MNKHTPGPWHLGSLPPPRWRFICDDSGDTIASVAEWDGDGDLIQEFTDNAEANAWLIAAAPDLLKICRNILHWDKFADHGLPHDLERDLEAAIAKAEGRS